MKHSWYPGTHQSWPTVAWIHIGSTFPNLSYRSIPPPFYFFGAPFRSYWTYTSSWFWKYISYQRIRKWMLFMLNEHYLISQYYALPSMVLNFSVLIRAYMDRSENMELFLKAALNFKYLFWLACNIFRPFAWSTGDSNFFFSNHFFRLRSCFTWIKVIRKRRIPED